MSGRILLDQFKWDKDKNLLTIYVKDLPHEVCTSVSWDTPFEVKSHVTGKIVVYIKIEQISGHKKNTWSKIVCSPLYRSDRALPDIHIFPGRPLNQ